MVFQIGNQYGKQATGRPKSGFASILDRADHFSEVYSAREILALASNQKELSKKHTTRDVIAIMQLANMLNCEDKIFGATERERLLDRVIGKPKQSVDVQHSGGIAVVQAGIQDIKSWLGEVIDGETKDSDGVVREERLVLPSTLSDEKAVR